MNPNHARFPGVRSLARAYYLFRVRRRIKILAHIYVHSGRIPTRLLRRHQSLWYRTQQTKFFLYVPSCVWRLTYRTVNRIGTKLINCCLHCTDPVWMLVRIRNRLFFSYFLHSLVLYKKKPTSRESGFRYRYLWGRASALLFCAGGGGGVVVEDPTLVWLPRASRGWRRRRSGRASLPVLAHSPRRL
jgi:hypothetical protein